MKAIPLQMKVKSADAFGFLLPWRRDWAGMRTKIRQLPLWL